ncbi:serine/threonine protein kinase [Candidatus Moduliflexus flocculans]|uniref:Serine/threonine protein kinase n=1 Tax=Candidatus Moduliflexus flocculans TaxID=1499966 RepID=A0A0S6W4I6_9BACT|nr:serine/threonine protein kinase [Candidatus Moduliflexus flocculans]
MIHFAYPNTNTRHKETIFIGCGRFIAATEPPGAEYREASPKITRSLETIFEAAASFAPEALENSPRIYEKQDRPYETYQGDSMSLAYLLALIHRFRSLILTDATGDIWCTGDIVRQPGTPKRFIVQPVEPDGFKIKLAAFLAPDNLDRLFIAPFANLGKNTSVLADKINIFEVANVRHVPFEQGNTRKTLLLVGSEELEHVINLLFVAPVKQPISLDKTPVQSKSSSLKTKKGIFIGIGVIILSLSSIFIAYINKEATVIEDKRNANIVKHLRSEPMTVSSDEAQQIFGLDKNWRPYKYIKNDFENRGNVVVDHATGLMWQKSGSPNTMAYQEVQAYIDKLNRDRFGSYNDWRLPTIPELMSLLEPTKANDVYIDPSTFDATQRWCWSSDPVTGLEFTWRIVFSTCQVYWSGQHTNIFVRAVRP